jgi:tripartite-type tricarboxylate transporter receptor subunit TctC
MKDGSLNRSILALVQRGNAPMAINRRDALALGFAAASARMLSPRSALAQPAYPDRPIRLIVPFPPGGAYDTIGRPWADRIKPLLGTVVIENIGGGGGSVGAAQASRARADGYTLLLGGATTHITEALLKNRPQYDPLKDLEPISGIAVTAFALAVHPSVPANDLKEFVAYAKATATPLFYGSTGPGSILHLMTEVLKRDTGIKLDHVPFRGAAPLVTELLSGRIQFGGDQLSSSLERVRSGQLKALAVATKSVALPNTPTVRALGFPNLELQGWNGFLAPKGTPDAIVARLQQEIAAAAKHPDVVKRMTDVGAEPSGSTQAEMRAMLREQIAKVRPVVEELQLVVQ